MADSAAVDAAQAAGYTVASTTGAVSAPVTGGSMDRLRRIVGGSGGHLEYSDVAAKASKTLYADSAGKEVVVEAVAAGTAGNALNIIIAVPADDNQAHAIDYAEAGNDCTVTLAVSGDGSTVVSTAADVVDKIVASGTQITARLGDSVGSRETLAKLTLEDVTATPGDDLIFTSKVSGGAFSVLIREPRGKTEEALTAVTVSVDNGTRIKVIVPATKTVANVKTAIEAHTAANALVTVTTAGTTTHAIALTGTRSGSGSAANRGTALATAVATQDLAGGVASAVALRVVPAVA
jgi:hypothetical protein